MNKKVLFLIAGILGSVVFIGYLGESDSHTIFGVAINIWIIRLAWLVIVIANFANYFKIKRSEKV